MDPLEILKALNEFYSNAFDQLINLAIAIFGLGGIALPITINYFQRKSLENERDSLKIELQDTINQYQNDLKENIEKKFDEEKEKITIKINEQVEGVRGITFFQQAIRNTNEKKYINAAKSYYWTIGPLFSSKDEGNVRIALNNLQSSVLPFLYKKDYEENEDLCDSMDSLIELLETNNINGRYSDDLYRIKKQLKIGKTKLKSSKIK